MKIIKLLITSFLLLLSLDAFASPSARRCMILPVRDSVGGALGYEVFAKVEGYLKSSRWCYYQYNSEIINILSNYKKNLDAALENPKVIKLVSEKTNAGSLIKVKIESLPKGVAVNMQIFGANGRDIYFNEKIELNSDDPGLIAQTVNNWLDQYEKQIPYDARVLGVLGQQFSIDLGKDAGIFTDYEVKVVRPMRRRKHPLLQEVVDWETKTIATGRIVHVGESLSQVKVLRYEDKSLIQAEDWVLISKNTKDSEKRNLKYDPVEGNDRTSSFGRLGEFGLALKIGTGSNNNSSISNGTKSINGVDFAIAFDSELWLTRNYWVGLELEKGFGKYSKDAGNLVSDSNSMDSSRFRLLAGYKYLPMGFFYGPQVDVFFGYGSYTHGFDNQVADGFTEINFSGILVGAKASMPLVRGIRIYFQFDFMLDPGYEEDVSIFGSAKDTSNFHVAAGAEYKYGPNINLYGGIDYLSDKAEFASDGTKVTVKNTALKGGVKFAF
ncbi:hypothetical protein M902_1537 [Bacteriovorax sp. BAL6_X]|uniref:porin family protein n=1 Tax=Bacteriovorax sp. BAL6_X TaxID=1201290 RepID=UPI000385DF9D|nr:porin family protein [Bacteriovorax sp. BAL6_X]EPZ50522.1 hypothetical protein M902_1537 [Bacteriovorax sp. BAL6_X]